MLLALLLAVAADTVVYPITNHGRPAGEMRVVRDADSIVVTYAHVDRQRGRWLQARYGVDASGNIVAGEYRPMTREGVVSAATERYRIVGDSVTFMRSGAERSMARRGGFFALGNATPFDLALQVRHLLAQPGLRAPALPSASVTRLEIAVDTMLPSARGLQRLRLAMLHGVGATPRAVWVDAEGGFAAGAVEWFIAYRADLASTLPALRAIEMAYRERAAAALSARVPVAHSGTIVIRNVDVFDSESGRVVPNQNVVIADGKIAAVAPDRGFRVARGATQVDGSGKTLIPGLWDMHYHVQLTTQTDAALRYLALGITGIRDLAADTDVATSLRDRANAGRILAPQVDLAGFIEGPQAWAGPSDVLVSTEAEARAWVARYDSLGYRQVKLYNLVHPDLVPTIAAEAQRRGMRVSGHIPRGLSIPAAIRLGFGEINHAAFLFSTFYQDSLYVPTMRAYSGVAAIVAPNIDIDFPQMTALIADLKAHGTVVDPTINLWLRDSTAADSVGARANNRAYLRLLKRLHDAGVPIVAGTDLSSLHRELEHYEMAGIPTADVLRIATLGATRVLGLEKSHGRVAQGYAADLVLIDGKPHERIADLRRVSLVFRAGRAYTPAALVETVNRSAFP